ncbi:MAG: flagellar hook-length control protein FliK [Syntrophales bacterium]
MKSELPMAGARPAAGRWAPQESLPPISGDLRDRLASAGQHDSPEPFQRVLLKSLHDQGRARDREDSSAGDRPVGNQDAGPERAKRTEGETPASAPAAGEPRDGRESLPAAKANGTNGEENSPGEPPGDEPNVLIPVGHPVLVLAYGHATPETSAVGRGWPDGGEGRAKEVKAAAASPQRPPEVGIDPRARERAGKAMPLAGADQGRQAGAAPTGAGSGAEEIPLAREGGKNAPVQARTALLTETGAGMIRGDSTDGPDGSVRRSSPESGGSPGVRGAASLQTGRASTAGASAASAQTTARSEKGGPEGAPAEQAPSAAKELGTRGAHPGVSPSGSQGEDPADGERPDPDQRMAALRIRHIQVGTEVGLTARRTKPDGTAAPGRTVGDGDTGIPNVADPRFAVRDEAAGQGRGAGMADAPSAAPAKTDLRGAVRHPLTGEKTSPSPKGSEAQTTESVPGGEASRAGESAVAGGNHDPSVATEGRLPMQRRQLGKEAFIAAGGTRPGSQGAAVEPAEKSTPETARDSGIAPSGRGGESRPDSGGKGASSGAPFGMAPAGRVYPQAMGDATPPPNAFAAAVADAAAITPGGEAAGETPMVRQVVEASQPLLQQGGGRIVISLTPPNLGSLDIDVRVKRDTVELFVVANNQDVQQTLCSHIDQLRKALVDQGLNMERFQVVVGDRSGSQQGRDPRQEGMAGWQGEARGDRGYQREAEDKQASDDALAVRRSDPYQSALGGINVFI